MFARNILNSSATANSFTEISINKTQTVLSITAYDFDLFLCFIYQLSSVAILLALAGDAGVAEAKFYDQ